jgi:hypothetical protein
MCNCHSEESIPQSSQKLWHPDDKVQATPARPGSTEIYRPDILGTIEAKIKELDAELRELSLDIHGMLCTRVTYGFVRKNSLVLQPIQNWVTKNSEGQISSPKLQRKTIVKFLAMPMSYIRRSWRSMDLRSRNSSIFQPHGRPLSPMGLVAGPSG